MDELGNALEFSVEPISIICYPLTLLVASYNVIQISITSQYISSLIMMSAIPYIDEDKVAN